MRKTLRKEGCLEAAEETGMECPKCRAENASNMTRCGNCGHSLSDTLVSVSERTERPDTIENLLSRDALRMENAIKERLAGKRGMLMRSLTLPMTFVFRSEFETSSIHVNEEGDVSIRKGETSKPMLLLESDHSTICSILRSREPRISAPGAIRLTVNWGPLRGMKIEIPDGQIMDHPMNDLYGYGPTSPFMQKSPPVRRRHLALVTILWASFVALTIVTYIAGFGGSRILNVIDFAFALVIAVLLSILLVIMLAVNVSARALIKKGL